MTDQTKWWRIDVSGYGDFAFRGTEAEAEEMRAHKAEWEGGVATKERIDEEHPLVIRKIRRMEAPDE